MINKLRILAEYLQQLYLVITRIYVLIHLTHRTYVVLISLCLLLQGEPLGLDTFDTYWHV